MRALGRITAVAAVLVTLAPAAARADDITADPLILRDLGVAQTYWGRTAPCVDYRVYEAPLQAANESGQAEEPGCSQTLAPELVEGALHPVDSLGRVDLCKTIVHEYGHSLGLDHSDDPASPMYPIADMSTAPMCNDQWVTLANVSVSLPRHHRRARARHRRTKVCSPRRRCKKSCSR